ncbi:hypothetical protein D3C79_940390 [compost metagenome]
MTFDLASEEAPNRHKSANNIPNDALMNNAGYPKISMNSPRRGGEDIAASEETK